MKKASSFLLLCLALLAGCAASRDTGSARLAVSVPQALSASISRVSITASAADFPSTSVNLSAANGAWGGLLGGLPVGSNRTFLAQAFDSSGTLRFQGQTSGVLISANETTAVALTLQDLSPSVPYANEAPVLDSLVASTTTVQPGASLQLTAAAHDPNPGDTLAFAWTATAGTFSAPTAAASTWTAPASTGAQVLTFTVTDFQGAAFSVSLAVNVVSGTSTGGASFTTSFNLWPTVTRLSASLVRLDAGQSTAVSALTSDADGDALTYQWTASCPGTWTNATSSTASFMPSARPGGACNNCRLTLTVQDGRGGQTTGLLNLCVTAASSLERFPPVFTSFAQSPASAAPGQRMTWDVTAKDPQASALSFAWSANTGVSGVPANGSTTSHLVWTAPSCVPPGTTPTVTATVTNAFSLTATRVFTVAGLPVCDPPGWALTGSMTSSREFPRAARLLNGKVLVLGGYGSNGALATTELYDPASSTWSATGSMRSARDFHTATLLNNGQVLTSGGISSGYGHLAEAALYDPASGTWIVTGPMRSARAGHTATLLNDGRVLVTGGHDGSYFLATVELYDPTSGTWSATGPMRSARDFHTATLLNNGQVLVSGGYNSDGDLATTELYDPASGTWSATGPMRSARAGHTATLLLNGKVLVTGGQDDANKVSFATAELYDPNSSTWSSTSPLSASRGFHTATLLNSGKVLVAGAWQGYDLDVYLGTAEVYDPNLGTWSLTNSMSAPRGFHTATLLFNGKVLIAGGRNNASGLIAAADLYTPDP